MGYNYQGKEYNSAQEAADDYFLGILTLGEVTTITQGLLALGQAGGPVNGPSWNPGPTGGSGGLSGLLSNPIVLLGGLYLLARK